MLKRSLRIRYRKDIITVLVIKIFALFFLWLFFFSHPLDDMLTKNDLSYRLLSIHSN